jgi:hypothetical protein
MTEEEWKARYKAQMMKRGISEAGAKFETEVLEFHGFAYDVEKDNPETSADETIESWVDDAD